MILIIFFILILAVGNILFYANTVNLQQTINHQTGKEQELELTNAELKNKLYQLLDLQNLSVLAKERGLIKIKNPGYLEINTALAANN